jgi:hypothetical protein
VSGTAQKAAFATGIPPDIYAFHHYTRNSTFLYCPRSRAVLVDLLGLSPNLSPPTYSTTYALFTPSKSGQRSPPTYYRGCWHVVSRGFFGWYRPCSSHPKGVYNPKTVVPHAASLHQAFAHCARFLAAASRRSLGRVSVPVWLVILSDQRPVIGLVGRYRTNYLMGRKPLHRHVPVFLVWISPRRAYAVLAPLSRSYPPPKGRFLPSSSAVCHSPACADPCDLHA